ncbi:hypothetical protein G6O69_25195 [Pseudenhygromyxa sp. WMMC2535]|uniref:hypothetical protein n=1 Tax=Pseudenhygromyxa sp. WMMC2535 TaxID=2712867 RepID=UPI001552E830|nr:hypothetical protein [Pseudenhygromyxa sp. WMMC2535]NVB41161.1 hypothetical protein [Pseudenhygromyxa sp. WMMC2535]
MTTLVGASACNRERVAKEGKVTQAQAEEYLRDAVHMSSEGVLLEPSAKGLTSIERVRFGEIAQEMRRPAAVCFVERAIQTMSPGEVEGEQAWVGVPEGQIKLRARVSVDGGVLATEVLDSGFDDEEMENCLLEMLGKQRFPESRDSFAYFVDVYYWVSLGFFREAGTERFAKALRREQAQAARRGLPCLRGRVSPGAYEISALNLFDRDGDTVVNRVERGSLDPEISTCLAQAFRAVKIHSEPDAFIRPAAMDVEFVVAEDGAVSFDDERWLELIELEEQAERERKKAELLGDGVDELEPDGFEDPGASGPVDMGPRGPAEPPGPSGPRPEGPAKDPGAGGGAKPGAIKPGAIKPGALGPDGSEADPQKDAPKADPSAPEGTPDEPPQPSERDPSTPGVKLDLSPRR